MPKWDIEASHHYWCTQDTVCLQNVQDCAGPAVLLPNNQTISTTKQGQLNISKHLSTKVQTAMDLPGLQSASLISIGQLCDDNCRVVLNNKKLVAIKTTPSSCNAL